MNSQKKWLSYKKKLYFFATQLLSFLVKIVLKDLNLQIVPKDCALRKKCPH